MHLRCSQSPRHASMPPRDDVGLVDWPLARSAPMTDSHRTSSTPAPVGLIRCKSTPAAPVDATYGAVLCRASVNATWMLYRRTTTVNVSRSGNERPRVKQTAAHYIQHTYSLSDKLVADIKSVLSVVCNVLSSRDLTVSVRFSASVDFALLAFKHSYSLGHDNLRHYRR